MSAVSVVIPATNEADSLRGVIERVRTTMTEAGIGCEIVVVVDSSTDAAAEEAAKLADRVIELPQTSGYGRSLKAGIQAATHDLIAITDADGAWPVERLPELIKLAESYGMVVGALRRPGAQVIRRLCEYATSRHIPDENSSLRVFRKSEIGPYLPSLDSGSRFGTTATLAYLFDDRAVAHLPVQAAPAAGPRATRPIGETVAGFQTVAEMILRHAPLRLFLLVAAPFAAIGLPAVGFGFLLALGARTFDWYVGTSLLGCAIFLAGVASVLAAAITLAAGMLATSLRGSGFAERAGQSLESRVGSARTSA